MQAWRRFRRNKLAVFGAVFLLVMVLVAIFADLIAPHPYHKQVLRERLFTPSLKHPFGTDELGRSVLSRIIFGTRISFVVGFLIVGSAATIGVILGVLSGFYGGTIDNVIMRLTDIVLSFPAILLSMAIVAALGPGLINAVIAIIIVAVPTFARLTRSRVLSVKEEDYIEGARAIGMHSTSIMLRHVVPNSVGPIIVHASLQIPRSIIYMATLSFLGIGAQPPTPEWGAMLSTARAYLRTSPHLTLFTGAALFLTALAFNAVGDGLRDALDPHTHSRY